MGFATHLRFLWCNLQDTAGGISKILQGRNSSRNLLVQVAGASLLGSNRLAVQNPSSANQYEFLHPNYVYSGIANTHTCNGIDAPRIGTYIHSYIYICICNIYIYIYVYTCTFIYVYMCVLNFIKKLFIDSFMWLFMTDSYVYSVVFCVFHVFMSLFIFYGTDLHSSLLRWIE